MKKILLSIFVISFVICNIAAAKTAYTPEVNSAIKMYKNRNYTESLQVMYEVVNKDPSNVLGYYYIAISEARLGNVEKSRAAYQRVIDLNTSTQLSKYAKNGIDCLDNPEICKTERNINPGQKAIDKVNTEIEDRKIQTVKDIVNQKQNIQDVPSNYLRDFKDYSRPENQIQNKSEADIPTKEEIADALDVLKRAGYQAVMPQPPMTQEMMQMSMINSLNNPNPYQNNYYMNPMAPYMSNNMDMSKVDPQLMQTMMMSSMLNGLYTDNK